MGYTSAVRKCIHIEIRRKFNLIHEKEWTGDTINSICKRYGVSRKTYYKWNNRYKQKGIEGLSDISLEDLIISDIESYNIRSRGGDNT
jgi:DNA invertase Pin-like site-specific DNA recombinase